MFIKEQLKISVTKKLVMREIGTSTKHDYTNAQMVTKASKNIIDDFDEVFTLKDDKTIYWCNLEYTNLDWYW